MKNISLLTLLLLALPVLAVNGWAQCPDGRPPPCRDGSPPKARCTTGGTILVRCGVPKCDVAVDGNEAGVTDEEGTLSVFAAEGSHTIVISKPGYDSAKLSASVACGKTKDVGVTLIARMVSIRIRTDPPGCEVYSGQELLGRSDEKGNLTLEEKPGSILVEARKAGYLSVSQSLDVTPERAGADIVFTLPPLAASLKVTSNVREARVKIDGRLESKSAGESFPLPPGKYRVLVEALGHTSLTFEVSLQPGERAERTAGLKRDSTDELLLKAKERLQNDAYADALQLCGYIFEADANKPKAHKFAGLALLGSKSRDYEAIKRHFEIALAAEETIPLPVRRHAGESFKLTGPHANCEGQLRLEKLQVRFLGKQDNREDFVVPYGAIQVAGIQTRNNQAAFLATKVTIGKGKKKEYNFYSPEDELSQAGTGYLRMVQDLLRPH